MASFRLAYPTDIPWKRRCVTTAMLDPRPCGPPSPPRWQPSIAVYEYQPPDDYQELQGHTVSFLKVTVTLSGWAPTGDSAYTPESKVWANDYNVRDPFVAPKYFACYGAILSMAVFPLDDRQAEFQKVRDHLIERFDRSLPADIKVLATTIADLLEAKEASGDAWIEQLESDVEWIDDHLDPDFLIDEVIEQISSGFPTHKRTLDEYPYISDVEPKRRDVYEMVQETGEIVSRTLRGVQVGKSSTHVESEEVLDVFGGASAGYGGASVGVQGQWGTKSLTSDQSQNLRNTDSSQEVRETSSHTTQLTQLYQLLSTYHPGTNRVLSFMLPRPHIRQVGDDRDDDISTFVDGPRELEGVQEFMYVITRPDDMANVRVEARVDTAHIDNAPIEERLEAGSHTFSFAVQGRTEEAENTTSDSSTLKTAVAAAVGAAGFVVPGAWLVGLAAGLFSSRETTRYYTWNVVTFTPPPGTRFDVGAGWSWSNITANKNVVATEVLEFTENKLVIIGTVYSETYKDSTLGMDWLNKDPDPSIGRYESDLVVSLIDEEPTVVGYEKTTFTVTHGLCCPPVFKLPKTGVVHEKPPMVVAYPVAKGRPLPLATARAEQLEIANYLTDGDSEGARYPKPIEVLDTAFYGRGAARRLGSEGTDKTVADAVEAGRIGLRELPDQIAAMSWVEALRTPVDVIDRLADRTGVGVRLRRVLLGVDAESVRSRTEPEVPDVVGLELGHARRLIDEAGLRATVTWEANEAAAGKVFDQQPAAGARVVPGFAMSVSVAQPTVMMPDLTGMELEDAMLALRRSGMTGDLTIEGRPGPIVDQQPAPCQRVAPDVDVEASTNRDEKPRAEDSERPEDS